MSDAPLQYVLSKEEWQYFRECEAEALRYRFLRNRDATNDYCLHCGYDGLELNVGEDLDRVIDAAMSNSDVTGLAPEHEKTK